jgi:hypothetical protein
VVCAIYIILFGSVNFLEGIFPISNKKVVL